MPISVQFVLFTILIANLVVIYTIFDDTVRRSCRDMFPGELDFTKSIGTSKVNSCI